LISKPIQRLGRQRRAGFSRGTEIQAAQHRISRLSCHRIKRSAALKPQDVRRSGHVALNHRTATVPQNRGAVRF
jgi:hypothetical protein